MSSVLSSSKLVIAPTLYATTFQIPLLLSPHLRSSLTPPILLVLLSLASVILITRITIIYMLIYHIGILTWESLSASISAHNDLCQFTTIELQREIDEIISENRESLGGHSPIRPFSASAIQRKLAATMSGFRDKYSSIRRTSSARVCSNTNSHSTISSRIVRSMKEVINLVKQTRTDSHRFIWDICLVVCILLYNFIVPIRLLAGSGIVSWWEYSTVIEYVLDAVLFCDCILHVTAYWYLPRNNDEAENSIRRKYYQQSNIASKPLLSLSQRRHLKRILATIICILPVNTLGLLFLSTDKLWSFMLLFKIPKLCSFYVLVSVIQDLRYWLDKEKGVALSAECMAVLYLTILTLIITLWVSAGWFYLHFDNEVPILLSVRSNVFSCYLLHKCFQPGGQCSKLAVLVLDHLRNSWIRGYLSHSH